MNLSKFRNCALTEAHAYCGGSQKLGTCETEEKSKEFIDGA